MRLSLILKAKYKKTQPVVKISTTNDFVEHKLNQDDNSIDIDLKTIENDEISIEFTNKDDNDDNVVELKKLSVDDIDLQHFIFEGTFVPVYNKEWYDSLDVKPPNVYRPGTVMRHQGVWSLPIKLPIWKMIMEQWINDEKTVA